MIGSLLPGSIPPIATEPASYDGGGWNPGARYPCSIHLSIRTLNSGVSHAVPVRVRVPATSRRSRTVFPLYVPHGVLRRFPGI
jgi:hypothetical protein